MRAINGWWVASQGEADIKEALRLAHVRANRAYLNDKDDKAKVQTAMKARAAFLEMLAADHGQAASKGIAPKAMTMLGDAYAL